MAPPGHTEPLGPFGIDPLAPPGPAVPPGPPGMLPDAPFGPAVPNEHRLPSGLTQPGSAAASGAVAIAAAAAPVKRTAASETVSSAMGIHIPQLTHTYVIVRDQPRLADICDVTSPHPARGSKTTTMKTLLAAAAAATGLLLCAAPVYADDVVVGPNVVVGPDVQVGPGIADPEPAGAVPVADAFDAAAQAAAGRPPCLTGDGVPYYTPGDAPCR